MNNYRNLWRKALEQNDIAEVGEVEKAIDHQITLIEARIVELTPLADQYHLDRTNEAARNAHGLRCEFASSLADGFEQIRELRQEAGAHCAKLLGWSNKDNNGTK